MTQQEENKTNSGYSLFFLFDCDPTDKNENREEFGFIMSIFPSNFDDICFVHHLIEMLNQLSE